MSSKTNELVPEKQILRMILVIRDKKVILDSDLAALYGVETRRLNEQVRRNIDKFPRGFYVSTHERGIRKLEVANCDIKSGLGRTEKSSIGVY